MSIMYNFKELTETKPLETYSQEQIKNIKLISANKKELATPFGSAVYRVQSYPGDLDLREIFIGCCSLVDVVDKFEKVLKRIAKDIKSNKLHYFSELKAGLDKRFDVDIGSISNGVFAPKRKQVLEYSLALHKKKLINADELKIIKKLLSVKNPGGDVYDGLYDIFREHRILRWDMDEVIRGYKNLPGNVKISLFEALTMKTYVKLDMITLVNDLIVEVTNFYILLYEDEGEHYTINLDYDFLDNQMKLTVYDSQIKEEIEKFYYSDLHYNPFKMAKRMWAYSRVFNLQNQLRILTPLVTGDVSFLYQIKSEVDTILRLYKLKKNPIATINKQIDLMKQKLSNILFIDKDDLLFIFSMIDAFLKASKNDKKEQILSKIKKYLVEIINIQTIQELNAINYNPPPRQFLPSKLKYATIVRYPYEVVIKPLNKFKGGEICSCGCQGGCECGCTKNLN